MKHHGSMSQSSVVVRVIHESLQLGSPIQSSLLKQQQDRDTLLMWVEECVGVWSDGVE